MAHLYLGVKPDGNTEDDVAPVSAIGPVSCRFRPLLPTDQQAMMMIGLQALNAPKQLLSHYTILKDMIQSADPEGEIDRIAVEQALHSPEMAQTWIGEALRRAGIQRPQPATPPPGILDQFGNPITPGQVPGAQPPPGIPGQVASGVPPTPLPGGPVRQIAPTLPAPQGQMPPGGGRPAGAYPGQPGGPNR